MFSLALPGRGLRRGLAPRPTQNRPASCIASLGCNEPTPNPSGNPTHAQHKIAPSLRDEGAQPLTSGPLWNIIFLSGWKKEGSSIGPSHRLLDSWRSRSRPCRRPRRWRSCSQRIRRPAICSSGQPKEPCRWSSSSAGSRGSTSCATGPCRPGR